MAQKNIKHITGYLDLALDIIKLLVEAIIDRGGTIEHLRRIVNEPNLRGQIADILVGAKETVRGTFVAFVDYVQPKFTYLESVFNRVYVGFADADFKPIHLCGDVSLEKCEVTFEYLHQNRYASNDAILEEMDRRCLRPALYEELLAFAKANPDEQRKFPILALGSVAVVDGIQVVARLDAGVGGRSLCLQGIDHDGERFRRERFLVVRNK